MGDRVYVTFAIRGRIETVETLEAVCESIAEHGLSDLSDYSAIADADDAKQLIADALEAGDVSVIFCDEQCNYADLSALEATCKEHGISYQFDWEAGCEFSAGSSAFAPEHGEATEYQDDSLGADIIELLRLPDAEAIAAIRKRVAVADLARNEARLPNLSASDTVLSHLREWESEE